MQEKQKINAKKNAKIKAEAVITSQKKPAEIKTTDQDVHKNVEQEKIKPEIQPVPKPKQAKNSLQDEEKTRMPSTALLDRALDDGSSLSKEDLSSLASLLELKLAEFGVTADVVSVLPVYLNTVSPTEQTPASTKLPVESKVITSLLMLLTTAVVLLV